MVILTIRTDKPEAEIGLFEDDQRLAYEVWYAHRELSATIHQKVIAMLQAHGKELADVQGVVCFAGPGSFTGLRIGITVGNALADGLDIPILAAKGDQWLEQGVESLRHNKGGKLALPEYGAPVHITVQRK